MGAHAFRKRHEIEAYGKPGLAGKADLGTFGEYKKGIERSPSGPIRSTLRAKVPVTALQKRHNPTRIDFA
jgi:hypothetical protein